MDKLNSKADMHMLTCLQWFETHIPPSSAVTEKVVTFATLKVEGQTKHMMRI